MPCTYYTAAKSRNWDLTTMRIEHGGAIIKNPDPETFIQQVSDALDAGGTLEYVNFQGSQHMAFIVFYPSD